MALQALHAQRLAGRGRHASRGEFHAVRWLKSRAVVCSVRDEWTVTRSQIDVLELLDGILPWTSIPRRGEKAQTATCLNCPFRVRYASGVVSRWNLCPESCNQFGGCAGLA